MEGAGEPSDIFKMKEKKIEQKDYEEDAKKMLFQYFINYLLSENSNELECLSMKLEPQKTFSKLPFPETKMLEQALVYIKKQNKKKKITDLSIFVKKLTE